MPTKVLEKTPSLPELLRATEKLSRIIVEKDREIVKLKEQLAQAGKLATLGLQGAGIAHELNNPLTVISAEADEILDAFENDEFDPDQTQSSANNIKCFAERMRIIIDHIRQYAREDKAANWTAINLNEPINDSLLMFRRQLETSGITVNASLAEDLPQIWGQYNKLESIFQNLIANARDAFDTIRDDRDKQVHITSQATEDRIVVRITDNGCGMDNDLIQRIYTPFFTTKSRENGTGIGLSMVSDIIKEHHGEIQVESTPDSGTTFQLSFPLERRNQAA